MVYGVIWENIKMKKSFLPEYNKILNRGPDRSKYEYVINKEESISQDKPSVFFGFHRLAINDLSAAGDQPMSLYTSTLIANGEIFNYKDLIDKYNITDYKSSSDCEIILHLYHKIGIKKLVEELDGEYVFALYDKKDDILYLARDPFGVRPLFIGYDHDNNLYFCSELKGISNLCHNIRQFQPGCYYNANTKQYIRYYNYIYPTIDENNIDIICANIKLHLVNAVKKGYYLIVLLVVYYLVV